MMVGHKLKSMPERSIQCLNSNRVQKPSKKTAIKCPIEPCLCACIRTMCNGESTRQSQGGTIAILSPPYSSVPGNEVLGIEGELYFRRVDGLEHGTQASFQPRNRCNGQALTGCTVVIQ